MKTRSALNARLFASLAIAAVLGMASVSLALAATGDLIRDDSHAGIHKKLIISSEGVALYDKPDGASTRTLKPFDIYFQLWPSEDAKTSKSEEQNGWVRIGDAKGDELGWVKKDKVKDPQTQQEQLPFIPWLSRLTLIPVEKSTSPFVVSVEANGQQGNITWTGRGGKSKRALVPILDDQAGAESYKVAFFLAKPEPQAGSTPVASPEITARDINMDLVFVIDTTKSMTPLIDATKDVVRQCVEMLKQTNPEMRSGVRFGLVAYQDATPGLKPFEIVSKLTDANAFQEKLKPLAATSEGSQEPAEDVLAGLMASMSPEMGWNPTAIRHVILLGDASAHLSGPKNTTGMTIEAVLQAAQKQSGGELVNDLSSITFSSVRAKQPEVDAEEDRACREQFSLISQNLGRRVGQFYDVDPNDPADKAKVVQGLTTFFQTGLKSLSALRSGNSAVVKTLADQGTSAPAAQLWRIDEKLQSANLPLVPEGVAAERDKDGSLVATKAVFLSKADIKKLGSTLDFLYSRLEQAQEAGERGDVATLMGELQILVAGQEIGEKLDKGMSLKKIIEDLPLKSDALEITIDQLASLQDDAFKEWLDKLNRTKTTAGKLLDVADSEWLPLADDAKASSDRDLFREIRLEEMP